MFYKNKSLHQIFKKMKTKTKYYYLTALDYEHETE